MLYEPGTKVQAVRRWEYEGKKYEEVIDGELLDYISIGLGQYSARIAHKVGVCKATTWVADADVTPRDGNE